MKIIFWTLIDDVLKAYLPLNKPLQELSQKYELYTMCSGEEAIALTKKHYRSNIIVTKNDVRLKGKILFEHLKQRDDYDVLVKIDLDAVILDLDKLISEIETYVKPMTIVGNQRKSYTGRMYMRGGCNATHKTVIDKIVMNIPETPTGFDNPFNLGVLATGATQINHQLFEICQAPTGQFPVWHPPKIKEGLEGIPLRYKVVKKVMNNIANEVKKRNSSVNEVISNKKKGIVLNIKTFPIKGDLSRKDAEVLIKYSQGRNVFEIGAGGSTILLSVFSNAKVTTCEDKPNWFDLTNKNLDLYGNYIRSRSNLILSKGYEDLKNHYSKETFVFIDCVKDKRFFCANALFKIAPIGTIFMFHDCRKPQGKGPTLKMLNENFDVILLCKINVEGSNMSIIEKGPRYPLENWNEVESNDNRVSPFDDNIGVI